MTTWRAGQRITADLLQDISIADEATYTPTITGGGSATFTTATGAYYILGDLVFVRTYLVASGAGSGTANFQVDMPTTVDRTLRQCLRVHAESIKASGGAAGTWISTTRGGEAVFFTSGTGATIDRIRLDDVDGDGENNVVGQDISSSTLIIIQGTYKKGS